MVSERDQREPERKASQRPEPDAAAPHPDAAAPAETAAEGGPASRAGVRRGSGDEADHAGNAEHAETVASADATDAAGTGATAKDAHLGDTGDTGDAGDDADEAADGADEAADDADEAGDTGGPDATTAAADGARDDADAEPVDGTAAGADRHAEEAPRASTGRSRQRAATPPRGRRGLIAVVSVVGELLITAGLVLGLFVVYSLWWTNVEANREARRQSEQVREHWREQGPGGPEEPSALDLKDGIGFLHVPAMSDEPILVKLGTDPKQLNKGVAGVYQKPRKAAMPWDRSGNFSLAAHRDGHGAKFHNIHKIDVGDPVVFETRNTWYVYKVYAKLPKTSKYNVDVLDPVPRESGRKKEGRYLTLTTCTPIFTSDHRYVVWGELVRTEEVDAERTPPKELR